MTMLKIVIAGLLMSMVCGLGACKRSDPPPIVTNTQSDGSAGQVKASPSEDKTPEYVKDLRKDEQKARDVGALEQKAAEAEAKATDEATK